MATTSPSPPPPSSPSALASSDRGTTPNPEPSLPSYGSPQPSEAHTHTTATTAVPDVNDRFANAPEVAPDQDAFANAPEVVTHNEKQLLPPGYKPADSAGLIPSGYNASADSAPEPVSTLGGSSAAAAAPGGGEGGSRGAGKVCGLKRKTFFIVLAVAIVLVIGAIVGGVLGGLYASGKMPGSSDDGSSGDYDDVPWAPQETGPIEPSERNMAAALSLRGSDEAQNLRVFYQDLNQSRILYRTVDDDEPGSEQALDLDIEPSWGTPLAATGLSAGDRMAQIFYISLEKDTYDITQATLNCTRDPCAVKSNHVISANVSAPVSESSQLGALRLLNEDRDRVRVYYQDTGKSIWALAADGNGNMEWSANHVIGNAYPGTSIVATGPNSTAINLYFVSNKSERLRQIEYDDSLGPSSGK